MKNIVVSKFKAYARKKYVNLPTPGLLESRNTKGDFLFLHPVKT